MKYEQERTVSCSIQNSWSLGKKMPPIITPGGTIPSAKNTSTTCWTESENWRMLALVYRSVRRRSPSTYCMLGIFSLFCCRLLTFFKINFFPKRTFKNTIRVSIGLGSGQDRRSVGLDLGPNCLQILSADDTRKELMALEHGVYIEPLGSLNIQHQSYIVCCVWPIRHSLPRSFYNKG